jgi:hypothetical protein
MEAAGISAQLFQQGVKEMQGILMNKYEAIRDTRISVNLNTKRVFI